MALSSAGHRIVDAIAPAFVKRGKANVYVPNEARKTVAFLGIQVDGRFVPKATGFFINFNQGSYSFPYLVTAEHVISGLIGRGHDIWVRTNYVDGSACEANFGKEDWTFNTGNEEEHSDVAVCMAVVQDNEDVLHIAFGGDQSFLLTDERNKNIRVGVGDEVAIVGLFRSHYGKEKNVPIVRIGNIAAIAEEPVHTQYCGYTTAHLIEARSISGLSGSPVFVNMPPVQVDQNGLVASGTRLFLFGLMHGHFDVQNVTEDIVTEDVGGQTVGVNTGIGVVIPTSKIVETLMQDELVDQRKELIEDLKSRGAATPDSAQDASPSS